VWLRRAALVIAFCGFAATAAAVEEGGRAPEIGADDLGGHRVTIAELRGQVFIVDVWATYGGPCAHELPMLQALYDAHHAEGFSVIAMTAESGRPGVEAFVRRLHLTFPVVQNAGAVGRYAAPAQPTSYIVDRRGIVRHVHAGYRARDATTIADEVRTLLAEPRP
jgi:peroxiredoxin